MAEVSFIRTRQGLVPATEVQRMGVDRVAWWEGPYELTRFTIEDFKAIKATYRAKTKNLKGRAA